MEYREDIEQLVKNTFDNFEPEVHPDVWANIQNSLNVAAATTAGSAANTVSTGAKLAVVSSKFSWMALIGVTSTIIGITATIIYFSAGHQTSNTQVEKHANTIQNAVPVSPDSEAENKNSFETDYSSKKTEQPYSSTTSLKAEAADKDNVQQEQLPTEKSSSGKSENRETAVSNIEKKNVTGVTDNKNDLAEVKQPANSNQSVPPSSIPTEKPKENKLTEDRSDDQSPDAEKKTPSKDEEKSIEYYLGHISNVITPNADGNNDVFVIEGKELQSLKVTIYDRSGKIIHRWNNLHGFWDGKLNNGQPASTGEYIYSIFAQTNNGNPLTKKGSLHLLLK